jgi:hypothetical protein
VIQTKSAGVSSDKYHIRALVVIYKISAVIIGTIISLGILKAAATDAVVGQQGTAVHMKSVDVENQVETTQNPALHSAI